MDNSSSIVISEECGGSQTRMEPQICQHMEHSNHPKEQHSNQFPFFHLSRSGEQHSNQNVNYSSISQKDLESNAQHMELLYQPSELVTHIHITETKIEERIFDIENIVSQGVQHSKQDSGHPSTFQKHLEFNAQHMELSNHPLEFATRSHTTIIKIEELISNTRNMDSQGEEEIYDSLIEQVRLRVPNKDNSNCNVISEACDVYEILDFDEQACNLSRVLNETFFHQNGYESYSKIHTSIMVALNYGLSFAVVTATVYHFALFYGRLFWQQIKTPIQDLFSDVHTRLMKKNYEHVPQWWFFTCLYGTLGASQAITALKFQAWYLHENS